MTREELKNLIEGITDEQLKAILDINTADIGKAKKNHDEIQKENETLKNNIDDLKDKIKNLSEDLENAEDAKAELEKLQKEIKEKDEKEKADKADAELTTAIEAVLGEKEFTSEYARQGLISDMKTEIAKPENKGKGYAEILDAFTKDKNGIFVNPNQPADMSAMGAVENNVNENQMRAVMGLAPTKE
jgi:chromosome segregation protein